MDNKKCDLSIGLITKNEEKYLEKCLKALLPLKSLISCEIIVTDTGSTDNTVEIAKKYADKVLYFEWCDDFSLARNTAVEVARGEWFMYVDADEIFCSVDEIAEFIKSDKRDNYDNAYFTMKNYSDEDLKYYNIFYIKRLFNFVNGKRYFIGKIHETITGNDNTFKIESVIDHFGYISNVMDSKRKRNSILMREEFKNSPKDLRIVKLLMDTVEHDEIIELAYYAFDLMDNTDYSSIAYPKLILIIYVTLCYAYYEKNEFDNVIEITEKFLQCRYLKELNQKNNTPLLEMYFMYASALYKQEQPEDAIDVIDKYQKLYDVIQNNDGIIYGTVVPFAYSNVIAYNTSILLELDIYDKMSNSDGVVKTLKEKCINNYSEDELDLVKYIKYVIKYNQKDVANSIIKYVITNKYDYLNIYCIEDILEFVEFYFDDEDEFILEQLYDIIKSKNEYNNLKEQLVFIKLLELFVLNKSLLNVKNDNNLNEVFELYIESMYMYITKIYNNVVFNEESIGILKKQEKFCYLIYPALKTKESNIVEYVRALKLGLTCCKNFKDAITNAIDIIQSIKKEENNSLNTNSEFQALGEKIKLTIIQSIKNNEIDKAKLILEEYKKINPMDPDIVNLSNVICKL